jgi:probable phosphoglycerate mutase
MTHLYLIRHGDYVQMDEQQRLLDGGLSETGIQQAQRLRDRLAASKEIAADVLISSTLPRARQTTEILAPVFDLPIIYDDDVQEWHNTDGSITADEFMAGFKALLSTPEQITFHRPVPNGESRTEFMIRASFGLNRITQEHKGKSIVMVCHGGVVEASFGLFMAWSPFHLPPVALDPRHTSITHWQRVTLPMGNEKWMLERFNDAAHLRTPQT